MAPADFGQQNYPNVQYSFDNGVYQAINTKDVFPFNGDTSQADALVLTGMVGNKRTLAISFRGTDQLADFWDYPNFADYYAKFAPLIAALHNYLSNPKNQIQQVLVSGHSLGAGALQYFMKEFPPNTSSYTVQGYTDGSPGAEVDAGDTRIENFINTDDAVPVLGSVGTSPVTKAAIQVVANEAGGPAAGAAVGLLLSKLQPKTLAGSSIRIDNDPSYSLNFDDHSNKIYEADVAELSALANDDNSPFSDSTLGADLLDNTIYPGPTISVAMEAPTEKQITIKPTDDWALGNGGDKINWTIGDVGVTIDGGSGGSELVLPGLSSFYDWQAGNVSVGASPETVLTSFGVTLADLYRINKLVFLNTEQDPSKHAQVATGALNTETAPVNQYVVKLDGTTIKIQSPTAGQTAITVNPTYDYLDAGDQDLAVTGSGQGGDIVALGAGNDTVNEIGANNIIFVKDPATAGNLTINLASGNLSDPPVSSGDTVVAGDGNDTITAGYGSDDLTGGGGTNLFQGTAAALNNDTIEDLSATDTIRVVDASLSSFSAGLSAGSFVFGFGSSSSAYVITLATNPDAIGVTADPSTGVDLFLVSPSASGSIGFTQADETIVLDPAAIGSSGVTAIDGGGFGSDVLSISGSSIDLASLASHESPHPIYNFL